MKTGDTKQAVLLSIVAVAAIGFLLFRLLPRRGGLLPLAMASRSADRNKSESYDLPMNLLGNPFSHPKLAVPDAARGGSAVSPMADIDKHGALPLIPGAGSVGAITAASGPEESAGSTRNEEEEPHIALKAVVRVDEPLALISVEDKKAEMHKAGDEIAPNVKLLSVGDSFVTLSVLGRQRRIQVGDALGKSEKQ